jgi:hypothetical protein
LGCLTALRLKLNCSVLSELSYPPIVVYS